MEYFQPRRKQTQSNLPFITRPSVEREFLQFVSERDGFETLVHHNVKEAISQEAFKALPNETIGLLAGRVLRDERGPYTLVLAAQGARADEIEATPSHVRISANGNAQVRSRLETSAYGLDIIGWYHSHPRYPARFSPVDMTEQLTWRDPNHVGIVISGNDRVEPFGVYRGPHSILLQAGRSVPPPPPFLHEDSEPVTIQPVERRPEPARLVPPPVSKSALTKSEARMDAIASFLPLALAFGLLSTLLSLIWFNQRINRIEGSLANLRFDAGVVPMGAPTTTPAPLPPARAEEKNLPKHAVSAPKSDSVGRPTTKTLVATPPPPRRAAKNKKDRNRSAAKGSRTNSASGGNRNSLTKPTVVAQPNLTKPVVIPGQKPKSPSPGFAEKPTKP